MEGQLGAALQPRRRRSCGRRASPAAPACVIFQEWRRRSAGARAPLGSSSSCTTSGAARGAPPAPRAAALPAPRAAALPAPRAAAPPALRAVPLACGCGSAATSSAARPLLGSSPARAQAGVAIKTTSISPRIRRRIQPTIRAWGRLLHGSSGEPSPAPPKGTIVASPAAIASSRPATAGPRPRAAPAAPAQQPRQQLGRQQRAQARQRQRDGRPIRRAPPPPPARAGAAAPAGRVE